MKLLLLLDYDGTLTPIVKRPERAILSRKRKELLKQLSSSSQLKMAIISGRKLSEIKKLVAIPHLIYVGNHGFEIEVNGKHYLDKGKAVKWIINKLNLQNYLPIYLGDDQTDEDAFKALKGKGISFKIGKGKSRADFRLQNVREVYKLLAGLTF